MGPKMSFSPLKNRPQNKQKFVPSSCDDTLFGQRRISREIDQVPEWEPPWVDNGKTKLKSPPKPLLFYCPTAANSTSSSRSSSRMRSSCSTPESRKFKQVKFSPTYVDNSLFGMRRTKRSNSPPPKEFDAPWAKEEKKDKPLLFEYSATNLVFDSTDRFDSHRSSRSESRSSNKTASRDDRKSRPVRSSGVGNNSHFNLPERRPWR